MIWNGLEPALSRCSGRVGVPGSPTDRENVQLRAWRNSSGLRHGEERRERGAVCFRARAGGEQRRGAVEAKSRLETGAVSVNNEWGCR